jgi:uncharacterized surface protein with fasciclin (FAS1) repeats
MKNCFNKFILLLLLVPVAQCQRERDEYYAAPEWGRKPVYEVLQGEGRFGLYLQCVDKTLYATSLKGNGLWTVFAPNDDAFKAYLAAKGYGSVDDMPLGEVEKIVAYSMVYDRYELDHLSDIRTNGWDTLNSIKKKTAYYETIHREYDEYRQDSIWVVSPTTAASGGSASYALNDNNYKYLPFYMARYFGARQTPLTAEDYNVFYPNATYTGKNIQGASIVTQDMLASNGVAHELDGLNEPLPNLEDILFGDPSYSEFRKLVELKNPIKEPLFYSYFTSLAMTQYFQTMYPDRSISNVYAKTYAALDVPFNCERFSNALDDISPESEGYTVFIPNNEAIQDFVAEKIAGYGYSSVSELSVNLVQIFINAHLVTNMIWPGEYKGAKNVSDAYINGEGPGGSGYEAVCTDVRPASNGFFYGMRSYVKSPYFETVLAEVLLQPNTYMFLYEALNKYFASTLGQELLYCTLNGYAEEDYIVLLPTDEQLKADGFAYESDAFDFKGLGATVTDARMKRLVSSHVFKRINTAGCDTRFSFSADDPSPLGDQYGGYGYALSDNGDMLRYKGDQLQLVGNYDNSEWVTVTAGKKFLNGQVYTVDKLLQYTSTEDYTDGELLDYLARAKASNPNISKAVDYMEFFATNEKKKYTLSKESMWTVLLPTNDAIDSAVAHRYIRDLSNIKTLIADGDPNNVATGEGRLDTAISFFRYHIIPGALYLDDGYSKVLLSSGKVQDNAVTTTNLKIEVVNNTFLKVEKDVGDGNRLRFSTEKSAEFRSVAVVRGKDRSNLFGPRLVIHEVDGYLRHVSVE